MSVARLHPALAHHVAGSLGWKRLRPLQAQAIEPVVAGRDALLLAPTAAGKTEAGVLPLCSRMLSEGWEGLSVLYVSPLRALANDLEPRLTELLGYVGRRSGIWHGDVPEGRRRALLREPPDLLVTTPESLEVMLTSARIDHRRLFVDLRAILVDEIHAFAGDDRGWHLLAVLDRTERIAGRRLQRIGLSATVGNPRPLLAWLGDPDGAVVEVGRSDRAVEVRVDHVGSLRGAAKVMAGLHHGQKRLAFCDSRSQVEELAAALRGEGVDTYVSHSSISRDERRRAEEAFALGSNCVIVATGTLELGIDVGDLDRVIQIDAPATVASFVQRLGRSGRRADTQANTLFLTTRPEHLVRALALDLLRSRGVIEPILPPARPLHIAAQQLLALCLQEGAIGRATWSEWLTNSGVLSDADPPELADYMLEASLLASDGPLLMLGTETEARYGRRNFLELLSVFTTPPLVEVRHGRRQLGQVHQSSFVVRGNSTPVLLLGGRSWGLVDLDWRRKLAYVEPVTDPGRSRWVGSGPPLGFALCRAMREVLGGKASEAILSARARQELAAVCADHEWVAPDATSLVTRDGRKRWWTFAGTLANHELRWRLGPLADGSGTSDELSVPLRDGVTRTAMREQLAVEPVEELPIDLAAVDELKFSNCLPRKVAASVLRTRIRDPGAVETCRSEPIRSWTGAP